MNAPEQKFKVGAVSVAVWTRMAKTKTGNVFESKSVSLDRRYQDAQGNWQSANSLDTNDIPKAVLALQKAFEYLAMDTGQDQGAVVSEEDLM